MARGKKSSVSQKLGSSTKISQIDTTVLHDSNLYNYDEKIETLSLINEKLNYTELTEYSNGLLQKSYGLYQWVDVKTASLSTINGILLAALAVVFKDVSTTIFTSTITTLSFLSISISLCFCLFGVLPSMKSKHEKKIKKYENYNNLRAVKAISSLTYNEYREVFLASTTQSRLDNNIFQIVQMSCIIDRDQRYLRTGAVFTFIGVVCFLISLLIFSVNNIRQKNQLTQKERSKLVIIDSLRKDQHKKNITKSAKLVNQ